MPPSMRTRTPSPFSRFGSTVVASTSPTKMLTSAIASTVRSTPSTDDCSNRNAPVSLPTVAVSSLLRTDTA